MTTNLVLGLNEGLTNDDYHSSDGVSKSHLDDIAPPNTPKHYWHKRLNPEREPEEKSDALILGDAIHTAVLEPDNMSRFMEIPGDAPKRPSISQINAKNPSLSSKGAIDYWQAFDKENVGKIILKPDDLKMVYRVRDAIHTHPVAKGLFSGGRAEQSYYAVDDETGLLIKCRLDYDRVAEDGIIVDLKSTRCASPRKFGSAAYDDRYDVQGGWYPHVIQSYYGPGVVKSFIFVAIEKDEPHAVGVYYMERDQAISGLNKGMDDLRLIAHCREYDHWPDAGETPMPLQKPGWAK